MTGLIHIVVIGVLLALPAWAGDWSWTPQSAADLHKIQSRVQRLLPQAKRATVVVLGDGSGSGVIVSPEGLVLTAGHVSGKAGKELRVILPKGRIVRAQSLGAIKFADAGLVQLLTPGPFTFAEMVPAKESVPLGTWCFALGHPGGWDEHRGAVVRLGRVISVSKHTVRSDCKLVGGDSGGPLFDFLGRVIGVHSRISKAPDQNFHVPIATYRREWPERVPGRMAVLPGTHPE